jgi:hypothetical protein
MAQEPETGIRRDALGIHSLSRLGDGGLVRVLVTEQHVGPTPNPPCAISARRSSPYTGPITGSTVPPGSPGSLI